MLLRRRMAMGGMLLGALTVAMAHFCLGGMVGHVGCVGAVSSSSNGSGVMSSSPELAAVILRWNGGPGISKDQAKMSMEAAEEIWISSPPLNDILHPVAA